MTSLTILLMTPFVKVVNELIIRGLHIARRSGGEKKMGELVSSYDDGGKLTVGYTAREIQNCVYPTVLCLLACLSASVEKLSTGLMSLEPSVFYTDVTWAERVTFKMCPVFM